MLKLIVLVALAAVACANWDGEIKDIPGVSAANMDKLRQLLTPRPANKEEFKAKIEQWTAGLSASEKAAAEEFREQMRQKHHTGQPEASP
ncbi:hypothetical protein OESDEN_16842 [Oesophagostomum dentatum]|uniref:SXP/RAL-2 family protein Ani s 5-like cation-binding domain-containing protein n=1 Tax=Oesophagostomum dentatum TaxID=61180 RepID=A0A0B1SHT8_OESDE|nr:hypothetical protein OESDEN_16842 [Oesophagostomum dentatum]